MKIRPGVFVSPPIDANWFASFGSVVMRNLKPLAVGLFGNEHDTDINRREMG